MSSELSLVEVNLGPRSYVIAIGDGLLGESGPVLQNWLAAREKLSGAPKALLVTDTNVATTYAETVRASWERAGGLATLLVQPAGEEAKSLAHIERIYDALIALQADRTTTVVAIGGGVVGDAAGFAAATYARGIPFLQVPTTLLAAVDSSVGGKVGINHPLAKNMIGAFHQPHGVLIDTACLKSLSDRDYRCGLAEVVKYGVILDADFFGFLESNWAGINEREPALLERIVQRSCRLKADVVEADEYEKTGLRAVLNYGHTFGHAFEALAGYGELLHGEGVAVGMLHASRLAELRSQLDPRVTHRQRELLAKLGLPVKLPASMRFRADDVLSRMQLDKKASCGMPRFILPTRIGHVSLDASVPQQLVRTVLAEFESQA